MKGRLHNKVAIVTGGGTGIGEAICLEFAQEGAKVVVNCIRAAIAKYGRLDVLVNNAGVLLANAETDDVPVDVFDEQIRCNVRSTFLMTKYALPHLRETKGNIISAGSEGGVNGQPRNTGYGGTKAFLHAFMAGVAVEQAQYGVRANCVCPGPIDTAWTHKETGAVDADIEQALITATPLGRRGTPEEVAHVYAFLASDAASFVTAPCGWSMAASPPQRGPWVRWRGEKPPHRRHRRSICVMPTMGRGTSTS